MKWAIASDVGLERENNEDFARADPELGLFVIADGMGGHVGGEVASRVAVESAIEAVYNRSQSGATVNAEVVAQAVIEANTAVLEAARERRLTGMGTTLTLAQIRGRSLVLGHVGDTRAYLVTASGAEVLTTDQTVVSVLVQGGVISEAEASEHPERHILTQALGTDAEIDPEVVCVDLPGRGRLLLSSDGLHDLVSPAQLHELSRREDLDEAVAALIECAKGAGGYDNITAVLIEI